MHRLIYLLLFAACTQTPSGAVCPPDSASQPTYENFGREFMETYCTGCHSAAAPNRYGAPGDQNYDTEADVRLHATDIDAHAAAGPSSTNTAMPELAGPVRTAPTQAERERLGQFLACMQQ
ncbi:MAG TPA: hypothetical protein VIV11_17975 [Kofleriaceae bacterium]